MSENKIPARSFFDWCVRRSGGNQGGIAVAAQAAFHQNGISELAVSADLDLEKAVLGEKKSGIALVEKVVKHTVGILADAEKAGLDTVEGFRCVGVGWGEAEAVTVSAVETDGRAVSVSAARRSASVTVSRSSVPSTASAMARAISSCFSS